MIVLKHSTSSLSSTTCLSRSFTRSHRTQMVSLTPSNSRARLRHSWQAETCTVTCLCRTYVWVPTFLITLPLGHVVTMIFSLARGEPIPGCCFPHTILSCPCSAVAFLLSLSSTGQLFAGTERTLSSGRGSALPCKLPQCSHSQGLELSGQ